MKFLTRFDYQERADWLSPKRLAAWLTGIGYSERTEPAGLFARLTAAPCGVTGDAGAAAALITRTLVAALAALVEQIKALGKQIAE